MNRRPRPRRPIAKSPEAPVAGNVGFFAFVADGFTTSNGGDVVTGTTGFDGVGTVATGTTGFDGVGTVATGTTGAGGAGAGVWVPGGVIVAFRTELNTCPTTSAPT